MRTTNNFLDVTAVLNPTYCEPIKMDYASKNELQVNCIRSKKRVYYNKQTHTHMMS